MARLIVALVASALLAVASPSSADEGRIFRIGTGGESGTYYPIGSIIARALTQPRDSSACVNDCEAPDLVAVAQISNGSVSNVDDIGSGSLEAALAQADIVDWAYNGTGPFSGHQPNKRLRAVANLYRETIHLVSTRSTGIHTVAELRGKRVSLDEPGSGTLVAARLVLTAYGLRETDIEPRYLKPDHALAEMAAGALDAFFMVIGQGTPSLAPLIERGDLVLIPIDGAPAEAIAREHRFLQPATIPAGVYPRISATATLGVGAQLVVSADIEPDLVYRVAKALWSDETLRRFAEVGGKRWTIEPARALAGLSIPLHPGAERYYRETGQLK